MTYKEWTTKHNKKVDDILLKLNTDDIDEIIKYFNYDNMKEKEKDFCPLYKDNIKCHNMDNLNCFLCGCPHFIFNENPSTTNKTTIVSSCNINSKYKDEYYENPDKNNVVKIHCDCTNCFIPHKEGYVRNHLKQKNNVYRKIKDFSSFLAYVRK